MLTLYILSLTISILYLLWKSILLKDNIIFIFQDNKILDFSKLAMIIGRMVGIECLDSSKTSKYE